MRTQTVTTNNREKKTMSTKSKEKKATKETTVEPDFKVSYKYVRDKKSGKRLGLLYAVKDSENNLRVSWSLCSNRDTFNARRAGDEAQAKIVCNCHIPTKVKDFKNGTFPTEGFDTYDIYDGLPYLVAKELPTFIRGTSRYLKCKPSDKVIVYVRHKADVSLRRMYLAKIGGKLSY